MKKTFLLLLLSCFFTISWNWNPLSLKTKKNQELNFYSHWTVSALIQESPLRKNYINNSPPLITEKWVVQGNAVDGIKAYSKKRGKLLWSFDISSGVTGSILLDKGFIYFGGGDGFFYSLNLETGSLNWKYFISSSVAGQPVISGKNIYFLTQDQKLYALNIKGQLLWAYSHPLSSGTFVVRGDPRPAVSKKLVYSAFQDGSLLAFDKKTAKLKWKVKLGGQAAHFALKLDKKCLLVPAFDSYLFCLHPLTGKVLKKVVGGSASQLDGSGKIYQFYKDSLYAYSSKNFKLLWKKALKDPYPFAPSIFKGYIIYGFPTKGYLQIANAKNGNLMASYLFGKGLAGPISLDTSDNSIYFLSSDSYLHKVSIDF